MKKRVKATAGERSMWRVRTRCRHCFNLSMTLCCECRAEVYRIDAAIRRAVKARDAEWNARLDKFRADTRSDLSCSRNAAYVDQWMQCLDRLERHRRGWFKPTNGKAKP